MVPWVLSVPILSRSLPRSFAQDLSRAVDLDCAADVCAWERDRHIRNTDVDTVGAVLARGDRDRLDVRIHRGQHVQETDRLDWDPPVISPHDTPGPDRYRVRAETPGHRSGTGRRRTSTRPVSAEATAAGQRAAPVPFVITNCESRVSGRCMAWSSHVLVNSGRVAATRSNTTNVPGRTYTICRVQ